MRDWYNDPASSRQQKVLKFFGRSHDGPITKGLASRVVTSLFMTSGNRELWEKYVYLTGDEDHKSPELLPFDRGDLELVVVPEDWKPTTSRIRRQRGIANERMLEMATDILKDGVPFDDPVPEVLYEGKHYCCTGKFQYGSRSQCNEAIEHRGGYPQKGVTLETNYLVVGGELNPNWIQDSYGRKIEKSLIYKLEGQPISLLAEEDWALTLA